MSPTVQNKDENFTKGKEKLSFAEKARFAGLIWNYGTIHIGHDKRYDTYHPRIFIDMKNPIIFDYWRDIGGRVYPGKKGLYTLDIRPQYLVKKRLEELLPFIVGKEEKQICIALKILYLKEPRPISKEAKKEMRRLYEEWKESRKRLEEWIDNFKKKLPDLEKKLREPKGLPHKIWNRVHLLEDCSESPMDRVKRKHLRS